MAKNVPQGQWRFWPSRVETVILSAIISILGALSIDYRIYIAAPVIVGVVILTGILQILKVLSAKTATILTFAALPGMIVFWIAYGHIQEWGIVPTAEYVEDESRYGSYANRTAELEEPSSLRLEPCSLRMDGATSLYDLYLSYARAVFNQEHPQCVEASRTPQAYESLIRGSCDLIFAFRPSEAQLAAAEEAGRELRSIPVGYDAFVFFVSRDNPVDNLTVRQLKDIYSGRLTGWRELGGTNAKIVPFQRFEGSGSQSRMERFMNGETLLEADKEHRFRFMRGIVTEVARYRNSRSAIGYSFLYYVNDMMEGGNVKVLGVDGVKPDAHSLRDGSYPLAEEICIVTAGSDKPEVDKFIEWVFSPQGQTMLEAIGFIPIAPVPDGREKPKIRLVAGRRRETT